MCRTIAFSGRGEVEADNIGGFDRKVRVVALTPGLASHGVNLMVAQERPDILKVESPVASASRSPVQRANPSGASLSNSGRIRLSAAFV